MTACPVNAIVIAAETGEKRVDSRLCIGCHLCTLACPYGTAFALPASEKAPANKAVKCDLCGGQPACVASCPTDAIEFVDVDEAGAWLGPWGERVQSDFTNALMDTTTGDN
jgi:Fe-S-cluster-containing hydrogenase component 2